MHDTKKDDVKKKEPNELLRRERKLRHWTQAYLASKLSQLCDDEEVDEEDGDEREHGEVDEKMIGTWERGEFTPSPFWQKKLEKLFGKNAAELGFIKSQRPKEPEPSPTSTPLSQAPVHILVPPGSPIRLVTTDALLDGKREAPVIIVVNTPHASSGQIPRTSVLVDEQRQNHAYLPHRAGLQPALLIQELGSIASVEDFLEISTLVLSLARELYQCTPDELLAHVRRALRNIEMRQQRQEGENISRRQVLGFLVQLPAALFGLAERAIPQPLVADEVLPLYAASIPACWSLYFAGGMAEIELVLPDYLAQLSVLAQQPTKHQQLAASLASQEYQLDWLLALQHHDFGKALSSIKHAFAYAEIANDPNLQLSALVRQAHISFHLKHPRQQLLLHQKAMQYSKRVSPLLQGWLYIVSAESYAHPEIGDEQEALRFLGLAHDTFPDHPENDPNFSYVPINHYTLANHGVLTHLHLKHPKKAEEILTAVDATVPPTIVPRRVELWSRHTAVALASGDRDQTCHYFELTALSAKTLGSDLRLNEACEIYERMLAKWGNEQKVKDLVELLQPS